ncbi:hypothetical protein ACNO5E_14115 [Vibrio parahaemolyticus]
MLSVTDIRNASIRFPCFSCECEDEGYTIIMVSPTKIFQYWEKHNWYQRSPYVTSYKHDLPFDGCGERALSIVMAGNNNITLPAIELTLFNNRLGFPDGRHRVMVTHCLGIPLIPAKVKKLDSSKIEALLAN